MSSSSSQCVPEVQEKTPVSVLISEKLSSSKNTWTTKNHLLGLLDNAPSWMKPSTTVAAAQMKVQRFS